MTDSYSGDIERELRLYGSFAVCAKGNSMKPLLRNQRDMLIIETPESEPSKYDIVLYRDNKGRYILHRIVRVKAREYLIRGDNSYTDEIVPKERVIGILTAYNKDGKRYEAHSRKALMYARFWVFIYPIRKLFHKLSSLVRRAVRKIFKKR